MSNNDDFFNDLPSDMDISNPGQSHAQQMSQPMQPQVQQQMQQPMQPQPSPEPNYNQAPPQQAQMAHPQQQVISEILPISEEDMNKVLHLPQISIQCFYETAQTAQLLQQSAADRRMARPHVTMQAGGIVAACEFYQNAPTPNLIIIESRMQAEMLLNALDELASVCDAGTKVFILGHQNDIRLYRELVSKGVSDYLVLPLNPINLIESIHNVYHDPEAAPLGKSFAFFGAKGGVGSSTIAHNVSYMIANNIQDSVAIVDMDFAFGTLGLNFNKDPNQDIVELIHAPDRIDEITIDKMMVKHGGHLNLLANVVSVEKDWDITPAAVSTFLQTVAQCVSNSMIDLPHLWNDWTKQSLTQADQIVITATPDLACLRNAKNIVDYLKVHRSQDRDPLIIMNQLGMTKKPEISSKDFGETVGVPVIAEINFDPKLFGMAANNGLMIQEMAPNERILDTFNDITQHLVSKKPQVAAGKTSLLDRLIKRKSA